MKVYFTQFLLTFLVSSEIEIKFNFCQQFFKSIILLLTNTTDTKLQFEGEK